MKRLRVVGQFGNSHGAGASSRRFPAARGRAGSIFKLTQYPIALRLPFSYDLNDAARRE
jgi:hypothetical protein